MMIWWMDLVFVIALVILVWAAVRMYHASEAELEESGTEVDLREGVEWLYPQRLIRQAGMVPSVKEQSSQGKTFWRVLVGPAQSASERAVLLKKIKGVGFDDAYPVTN